MLFIKFFYLVLRSLLSVLQAYNNGHLPTYCEVSGLRGQWTGQVVRRWIARLVAGLRGWWVARLARSVDCGVGGLWGPVDCAVGGLCGRWAVWFVD